MKKYKIVLAFFLILLLLINVTGCHKKEVPMISPSPIVCPIPTITPSAMSTPIPTLPTIQLDVTSEGWSEEKEPYDIYGAMKAKLEGVGFEIAPQEGTEYDARLSVQYMEIPALPYKPSDDHPISIDCFIYLYDNCNGQIFSKLT